MVEMQEKCQEATAMLNLTKALRKYRANLNNRAAQAAFTDALGELSRFKDSGACKRKTQGQSTQQ
eukprot:1117040-Alexandrium_andersonii.AAC.1